MRFRGFAVALLAVLTAGAATAQPGAPIALTLDEAVRRALETSHRIAEAVARGEVASAGVGTRRAAGLPQVTASAGYTRTNHVDPFGVPTPTGQLGIIYPDIPDNYRTRLDVQWPLYTGGRLDALERAARLEATAAGGDTNAARNDLELDVARAFWSLVTAIESQHVVEQAIVRIGAHLRDVRNQFANGLVPPNDVLALEAQESRQRLLAVQAAAAKDIAEADLVRLVGLPPGTAVQPAGAVPPLPSPAADVAALVETAKRQRPERAALESRLAAAEQRVRAAAAGTRPAVAVGGGVDYARPNPRIFPRQGAWESSWDAGVNVSVPVFDGGRARSETAEAAATARAVRERLAELDDAVALEVRQRLREVEASRSAIAAADDGVRSATEARRVVGERFNAGVATSTDVLDAQVALLQAELDRTQAVANAHLADARLARALGVPRP